MFQIFSKYTYLIIIRIDIHLIMIRLHTLFLYNLIEGEEVDLAVVSIEHAVLTIFYLISVKGADIMPRCVGEVSL